MILEFILFVILLFLVTYKLSQKPKGLPPGDWGYPILGMIPRGRQHFDDIIASHQKRYGNGVYCMKIGSRTSIFITDYNLLKEAYNKLEFSGRPNFHTVHVFGEKLGISMSTGKVWQDNRRFTVKSLRDFGLGKSSMGPILDKEVEHLINYFEKKVGKPTTITSVINIAIVNGLWTLASGRRYDIEDKRIERFSDMNRENFDILQSAITFLDFYPLANKLPQYIKDTVFRAGDLRKNREDFKAFLLEVINEHKDKFDDDMVDPDTFIDQYLLHIKNITDPELDFKKKPLNLIHILINFFTGGSDSTSSNIRWLINFVAMYPEVQKKIHKELDENVPNHRFPSLEDKEKLPYFEAVMHESLRMGSLLLFGIPHSVVVDQELDGYRIPKDSVVFGCFEQCQKDPKYWTHPNQFYPEHFLDANGKFNGKRDGLVPFSIGKRMCPGESYAKMEIYLICSAMFQRFKITPAPGVTITHDPDKTSPFFNFPKQYEFIFEKRH